MVRVLVQGARALGLEAPELPDRPVHATVPLYLKRAVIQAVVEQGGLSCLPLLGRGVHVLAMEPTHLALTAGQDARSMFLRCQRLERYIHSRHRISITELAEQSASVVHAHRDRGQPPLPAEDLVVCGVLCALLEANGLQEVHATAADVELYPNPGAREVIKLVRTGQTASWLFTWQAPSKPVPAPNLPLPWPLVTPPLWSQLACTAGDLVARQLPELLQLDEAAAQLGLARRSLQRVLASEGLSFTKLVAEVRFRLAGWYLIKSKMSLAETGFVCGYADQAHLTREFNRRVGVTPAKYRSLFAAA
ncbi:MAG: helix-turn-helix transcriptional regulator [Rhodoferax sp.]|nr:helix-turn-helix transcriptional regulator [Rhodoferax sp.]